MLDPYLWDDVPILRNKLGIKDSALLETAESDITYAALVDIDLAVLLTFDLPHLCSIQHSCVVPSCPFF